MRKLRSSGVMHLGEHEKVVKVDSGVFFAGRRDAKQHMGRMKQ